MSTRLLRELFGNFEVPLKRARYTSNGLLFALVKFCGDFLLIWYGAGLLWTPIDYLDPAKLPLLHRVENAPYIYTLALMIWMVPFLWIGVVYTMRRALDAGWSPWWGIAFFVPYLNYGLIVMLCIWPSSDKYAVRERPRPPVHRDAAASTALGIAAGIVMALAMIGVAVVLKGEYAFGLFLGTPIGMGVVAGYFVTRGYEPTRTDLLMVSLAVNLVAALVILGVAFEGAICIAMAFPLSLLLTFGGACVGKEIAIGGRAIRRPAAAAMLLLPIFTLVEPAHLTGHTLHEVKSSIEINAPPLAVWPHVIAFSPMPAPTEIPFRLGLAYPQFAHIEGSGVGAVRYCVFSTGPFVEPITAWEPAQRLAFNVESSPAPLKELSFYRDVEPPHLHGYVRSKRGEFRFVALPDGRTRLEGSTWYELEMAPEHYWSLWVDATIHDIHDRVLAHIKQEVESQAVTASAAPSPTGDSRQIVNALLPPPVSKHSR